MARSAWQQSSETFDAQEINMLAISYWRRKRLEARLMANELARVLAGGRQQQRTPTATAAAQFFGV